VGAGGRLTGYAGGLDRKRHLLALEAPPAPAPAELSLFEA
jgi:methylated-DNA-[protein]-cysteine S-methyltransferase